MIWWRNAYGLDVKILSPAHGARGGVLAIEIGGVLLMLGYMNRAQGNERLRLNWLYLYLGSMIVVVLQILTTKDMGHVPQHTALFCFSVAIAVPTSPIGSRHRVGPAPERDRCCLHDVLSRQPDMDSGAVPCRTKLARVLVSHFIPPDFPLLLIVPSLPSICCIEIVHGGQRWPSLKATKKLRERVREIISKRASRKDVKQIVAELTPVLRGWGKLFPDCYRQPGVPQGGFVRGVESTPLAISARRAKNSEASALDWRSALRNGFAPVVGYGEIPSASHTQKIIVKPWPENGTHGFKEGFRKRAA